MQLRKRDALAAVAALAGAVAVVGYATSARSADHQDSPAVRMEPTADINDVFSWMDGNNVVLAMTVYPDAPTGAQFSNTVKYVFHTNSASAFAPTLPTSGGVDVVATFDNGSPQKISLWVGTSEFVTGDASGTSGLASADGKVKVFAGVRADPFFFNIDGFHAVVADVENAASGLTFNDAGCPALNAATSAALVAQLDESPDGGAAQNHFATFNGMAIVVSVDKSLLTANGSDLSVWAATTN